MTLRDLEKCKPHGVGLGRAKVIDRTNSVVYSALPDPSRLARAVNEIDSYDASAPGLIATPPGRVPSGCGSVKEIESLKAMHEATNLIHQPGRAGWGPVFARPVAVATNLVHRPGQARMWSDRPKPNTLEAKGNS